MNELLNEKVLEFLRQHAVVVEPSAEAGEDGQGAENNADQTNRADEQD